MLRFLCISLILMGCCRWSLSCRAQRIRVSEPLDVYQDVENRFVGYFQDTVLLYRRTRGRLLLQPIDTALNWGRECEVSSEYTNTLKPVQFFSDKKQLYFVYSYLQKGKLYLRLQRMDSQARLLSDLQIAEFEQAGTLRSFEALLSEDKQTLLLFNITFEGNIELVNYDLQNDRLRWQRYLALEEVDYYKEFLQLFANNQGEVFIVFEKNNLRKKKDLHEFALYRLDTAARIRLHHIPFPDALSYGCRFAYDERNRRVVAAGLCAGASGYEAKGLFYLQTDPEDSAAVAPRTTDFEEAFMRSLTGERRRKLDGVANFQIQDLVLRRDGGVLLVAEQQLKYEYRSSSMFFQPDMGARQVDYLYENVLVASLHPGGELHWKNVLYKSQSSENDQGRYSSYFLLKTAAHLRFLYNDEVKREADMFEYVIDGAGTVRRNLLPRIASGQQRLLPEFRSSIQYAANEVLIPARRNNKLYVLQLRYD